MLIDENVVEQEDVITDHVLRYYENLHQEGNHSRNNLIFSLIPSMVSMEHSSSLAAVPSEKEIFDTINVMSLFSAPGPDGFGGIFFKTF